jgi:hypothetical protein
MKTVKKKIKFLYLLIYNLFLDSHIQATDTPNISFIKKVKLTLIYRLAGWFNLFFRNNERNIYALKNKHIGERCFIIGNGPSLNNIDLTKLKNEITFGVNAIYTNEEKMEFLPTYYVVEDIFVAEDRKDEINKFKGSQKFFGNYFKYCISDAEDVNWLNVRFRYDDYNDFPYFSKNALRQVWTGGTVSYINLQLAYYMGFKEVYLVGFDHSYLIPKDVKVNGTEILSLGDDVNHFNKDYFGKGKRWHDPRVDRMELSYLKAKKYYEKDGRQIFNASPGSKLNVFPLKEYNSIFK